MKSNLLGRVVGLVGSLIPSGDLSQRTAKSGVWAFASNAVDRVLYLVMIVVVARILGPTVYGTYVLALVVIGAAEEFTELGTKEALIQKDREDVDEFLDTTWVLEAARGVLILGLVVLATPLVTASFGESTLLSVLPVMATAFVARGLRNPAVVYFSKRLEFHKEFAYRVVGTVVQFGLGVGLAFLWGSIWALVVAYVGTELARTLVSYPLFSYRPRFRFSYDRATDLIDYGKWITGTSALYYLYDRGDDILVGLLVSSTALGWYQLAYRLSNAPATEVSDVVSEVMLPTFAKLQNDEAALRRSLFTSLRLTTFVAFPMAFGVASIAPPFVRVVLGSDWIPMTPVLQIMPFLGLLVAVSSPMKRLWQAVGRPDLEVRVSVVRVLSMALLIYPAAVEFGIVGVAAVVVVSYLVFVLPVYLYYTSSVAAISYKSLCVELGYPLVASGAMASITLVARRMVPGAGTAGVVVGLVVLGVVVYTVSVVFLIRATNWRVGEDISGLKSALG